MDKEKQHSFFTKDSYISLWEAGIRWAGYKVGEVGIHNIPEPVQDAFRSLIEGQLNGGLTILNDQGYPSSSDGPETIQHNADGTKEIKHPEWQEMREFEYKTIESHIRTLSEATFNLYRLENTFLYPKEIGEWALEKNLPFPDFCYSADQRKKLEAEYSKKQLEPEDAINDTSSRMNKEVIDKFWGKLRNEQKFRLMARQVAKKLWEKDPTLTIVAICENDFIKTYCAGQNYTDKDTIRGWIKDLDPRDPENRGGRPKTI